MAQVRWTLGAVLDLEEISGYLSRTSDNYASELVESLLNAIAGLEALPRMGRIVPENRMERLRELIVRDCRVVYLLGANDEDVRIFAIQHGGRDLMRRLGDQPWESN